MKKIDCLGDMCPLPIMKARRALKTCKPGESVIVVSDHSCVVESMHSNFKGYKISHDEVINGVWEVTIEK